MKKGFYLPLVIPEGVTAIGARAFACSGLKSLDVKPSTPPAAGENLFDGLIELLAIKDMSRRKFVSLFSKYKAGKIFSIRGVEDIASYTQARNILIEPMLGPRMKFVADGEIFETGALRIEVVPKAVKVMMLS